MQFKRSVLLIWVMVWGIFGISTLVQAKSVYAVASHGTSNINAYLVDPNGTIDFQKTVEDTEHFGNGATGLCVWPSVDRMFVTYESDARIAWGSTKTLCRDTDDEITAPEINLAGVIADETNNVLYVVGRNSGNLYTYQFDVQNDTLMLTYPNGQSYRHLEGLGNPTYGMAIDEDGGPLYFGLPTGLLYVANGSSTIRYYNTTTWELEGTVDVGRPAVCIDVDGNGYLYAGGHMAHTYLMQYDFNDSDPNTALIEKNMGYNITDIIADKDTGILYTTTRQVVNNRTGTVEVYDPAYWDSSDPNDFFLDMDSRSNFGGPAGIGIGSQYKPGNGMFIQKIDDVTGCVLPDDIYHYDITYRPGPEDESNVVITDKLPIGVDFVSADPNTGYYTERPIHTYTWELGDVSGWDPNVPGDPNHYFELTVRVNEWAEPAGILYNKVMAESDRSYTEDDEQTAVFWWGPGDGYGLYVDWNAPGPHIGTSWQTAYLNLTDALARAAQFDGDPNLLTIYVADGMYKPGTNPSDDFFDVHDGITVYGGYAGYGTANPDERNPKKYKTILNGFISDTSRNYAVVKMGNNTCLNGFTVKESQDYGIYGYGNDFTIENCIITDNLEIGVYCENGNLTLQWCEIYDNGQQGVYHTGSGKTLTVENCRIHNNQFDGIRTVSSTSTITNSVIYQSGSSSDAYNTYYGIHLLNPSGSPDIHNNTIVHNANEGVRFVGSNTPAIANCIVYFNGGDSQLVGLNADIDADYCCIQDCNEIPTNSNFNDDPNFVYDSEPYGYYHIKYESPCRNTGDSSVYTTGDVDMDNTERKQENVVDVGADEVSCEDTWDENDWTYDGVINLQEYAIFSAAWLSHDPNDPDITTDPNYIGEPNYVDPNTYANWQETWNPICDLDTDYDVDLADFSSFCESWLWEACWRTNYVAVMYGTTSSGTESMAIAAPALMSTSATLESRPVEAKTIKQQILSLEDCIELLEEIWLEDPCIQKEIDPDDWKRFMDAVYGTLDGLKAYSIQKE